MRVEIESRDANAPYLASPEGGYFIGGEAGGLLVWRTQPDGTHQLHGYLVPEDQVRSSTNGYRGLNRALKLFPDMQAPPAWDAPSRLRFASETRLELDYFENAIASYDLTVPASATAEFPPPIKPTLLASSQPVKTLEETLDNRRWPVQSGQFESGRAQSDDLRWLLGRFDHLGGYGCSLNLWIIDLEAQSPPVKLDVSAGSYERGPDLRDDDYDAGDVDDRRCATVEFSPGGSWLVVGHQLWSLKEPNLLERLSLPYEVITISPDDRYAIVRKVYRSGPTYDAQYGYELAAIPLHPGTLARQACAVAGRNLSPSEWSTQFPGEDYRAICQERPIPDELEPETQG